MQLPHDSSELRLRERCIQEVREHMPFVRCYVLPMTGIGPLPLFPETFVSQKDSKRRGKPSGDR